MKNSITEIQTMTETEKLFHCRERLEEYHLENQDFKAALQDKWALTMFWGGN